MASVTSHGYEATYDRSHPQIPGQDKETRPRGGSGSLMSHPPVAPEEVRQSPLNGDELSEASSGTPWGGNSPGYLVSSSDTRPTDSDEFSLSLLGS